MSRKIQQKLLLLVLSISLTLNIQPSTVILNYTDPLICKTKLGDSKFEVEMILSTLNTNNILFSNANRKYSKEINEKRQSNQLLDNVEIDEQNLKTVLFNLKIDNTNLNNKNLQGEFGFGINSENKNEFIDYLKEKKIIKNKKVAIDSTDEENLKLNFDDAILNEKYYFCNKFQVPEKLEETIYSNGWICDLSHAFASNCNNENINEKQREKEKLFNETEQITGLAVFDSTSKYIYIPMQYVSFIQEELKLNRDDCIVQEENEEKYIICSGKNFDTKELKSLYLIIGGYGLEIKPKDYFEKIGKNTYKSLFRFKNTEVNLWAIGTPIFNCYKIQFDFDSQLVGFHPEKSNNLIDYTDDYLIWRKDYEEKLNDAKTKKIIVILIIILAIIIALLILLYIIHSVNKAKVESNRHNVLAEEEDRKFNSN